MRRPPPGPWVVVTVVVYFHSSRGLSWEVSHGLPIGMHTRIAFNIGSGKAKSVFLVSVFGGKACHMATFKHLQTTAPLDR